MVHTILSAALILSTTNATNIPNTMRDVTGSQEARDLLTRADEALNALTYSTYSTSNVWDTLSGVYKVVCVYYLNHLVDDALPEHYDAMLEMVDKTGIRRLGTEDYYAIFKSIPYGQTASGWKRIERVADLRPGDVVIWKRLDGGSTFGHAFVIASVPARDTRWSGAYRIRITDATSSPHSNDSRGSSGSGVGAGEMLLRAGSTGRVYQLAWSTRGYWKDGGFAMARPVPY